ncbi:ABC transporter substrate-binding protein [Marinobacter pelagius]|uniref:ABC transporter substrate-binding protein n=1 Tax=Marinobacter sp. C7 TaxID=2951363 RepID=UPI001EF0CE3D|nr:ABC transporter substrate-binding protein [Marinobacter sp. C7]MCG7198120.1 ABC transporter substrate-binding protein [Marinobacter sp. C7]
MHRRRFLGASLAAGFAALGLSGCDAGRPLRFGIHPWIGYEPLYLAEEFGWLPSSVTLQKGQSALDSMELLSSGAIDGAALTLDEAIRVHVDGTELLVVGVTNVSVGADVLVVKKDIETLDALRGRRIGAEMSSVSGILLLNLLATAGIERGEVTIVDLPMDEHVAAWKQGDLDAVACYEPTASAMVGLGGVRLFDSSQLPETIFDVLVVTRKFAALGQGSVRDLLEAHFAGLRHLVRNQADSIYRVATRQGTSPAAVRSALASVMLPDLASNQRYLAENGRIERVARDLSRMLEREGLIPRALEVDRFCDSEFLPRSVA